MAYDNNQKHKHSEDVLIVDQEYLDKHPGNIWTNFYNAINDPKMKHSDLLTKKWQLFEPYKIDTEFIIKENDDINHNITDVYVCWDPNKLTIYPPCKKWNGKINQYRKKLDLFQWSSMNFAYFRKIDNDKKALIYDYGWEMDLNNHPSIDKELGINPENYDISALKYHLFNDHFNQWMYCSVPRKYLWYGKCQYCGKSDGLYFSAIDNDHIECVYEEFLKRRAMLPLKIQDKLGIL